MSPDYAAMVGKSRAQRYMVVAFDGVSLGIMSLAFGVSDMAAHCGVLPPGPPRPQIRDCYARLT